MNKYIKLVIAALFVAGGIFLIFNREIGWGIVMIFLAALPVLLFFKNEYTLLAIWKLRDQNMEESGKWIRKITNYQSQLHRSQYGYYHYLLGLTQAQENPTKNEELMKKALDFGLSMKHDRALATFNLAAAAMAKGRRAEAQKLLEDAKRLDTAGMLTESFKTVKEHMKKPNMQKHLHNPNMRHRGKFF